MVTPDPPFLWNVGLSACNSTVFKAKHSFLVLAQTCAEIYVVTFDVPVMNVCFRIERQMGADVWKR